MTAIQTLRDPKTERLIDKRTPQTRIDIDEPQETPLEWYRRWCRECDERRKLSGLPDESPLTMEEIVAICKEARAERYAKKQKNSTCH